MQKAILMVLFIALTCHRCALRAETPTANRDYVELRNAVLEGKSIRMTLDLSKCTVHGRAEAGPPFLGSLGFDAYMIEPDKSITFSTMHFTVRIDNTPVDEFLAFKLLPDGTIFAHTRSLQAATYAVFHESQFDCAIAKSVVFHW